MKIAIVFAVLLLCSCKESTIDRVPLLSESQGRQAGFRLNLPTLPKDFSGEEERCSREFKQNEHELLLFSRALRAEDGTTTFLLFNIANTADRPMVVYVIRNDHPTFKFFCRCDTGS